MRHPSALASWHCPQVWGSGVSAQLLEFKLDKHPGPHTVSTGLFVSTFSKLNSKLYSLPSPPCSDSNHA
jgi:hypothetical protein